MPPRSAKSRSRSRIHRHPRAGRARRGLVQDQYLRVSQQRVGDAEALAHPQRVLTDTLAGRGAVEADQVEQLVGATSIDAHGLRGDRERLAGPASAVLGRRVE